MPLVPVMERLSRRTTQRLAHGSRPCLLRRRSRNRTKGRETRRDERLEGEFEGDVADEAEEDAAVGVREGQRRDETWEMGGKQRTGRGVNRSRRYRAG